MDSRTRVLIHGDRACLCGVCTTKAWTVPEDLEHSRLALRTKVVGQERDSPTDQKQECAAL